MSRVRPIEDVFAELIELKSAAEREAYHCTIAFKYLARGNRRLAFEHFQRAVETHTVGSSDYTWPSPIGRA